MGGIFSKQSLKFELISIYEEYIKKYPNIDNFLKEKSRKTYLRVAGAGIVFGEPFEKSIDCLETIGWNFPEICSEKISVVSLEEAKKILEDLKKE